PLGRIAPLLVDQLFAARLVLVVAHASSFRNNEGAGRRRLRSLRTAWARRLRSRRRPCRRRTPPRSLRRTPHPRSRRPCRRPAPLPPGLPPASRFPTRTCRAPSVVGGRSFPPGFACETSVTLS